MQPALPFDEASYLAEYPDVAAAVKAGVIADGLQHFELHGRQEGRLGHKRRFHTGELDRFVATVDAAGGFHGEAAKPLIDGFTLAYDTVVDVGLDPYSDAYVAAQVGLYREISGRGLDQSINELTAFDVEAHAAAANPYGWREPSALVLHHLRMGKAIKEARLPARPRVLDLGAGWGLTSEFLAMLGAEVQAVDINPSFVDLINRRAERLSLPLKGTLGTFEDFVADGQFDLVFFYEALHHAVKPWTVIARCAASLKGSGKIAFAAEPIQDLWWPHWGLRLDGPAVYCIRKFGWFESGMSPAFASDMFRRVGLTLELQPDAESCGGFTGVASPRIDALSLEQVGKEWLGEGWTPDNGVYGSAGEAVLHPRGVDGYSRVILSVVNYRARPLAFRILDESGSQLQAGSMPCGHSEVSIDTATVDGPVTIHSDAWVPAEEYDTVDRRTVSFHLEGVALRV